VSKITILLADDHNVVRQCLRAVLDSQADLSVVGEAADGFDTVRLAERLRPNVLVADIFMPGLSGLEVVRQVARRAPATRMLILSVESDERLIREALANGATGYVVKDAPASELLNAIREVAAGKGYLSPGVSDAVISAYVKNSRTGETDDYQSLTGREREVLHLLVQGNTNSEIGKRLFISPRTVEVHRASLIRKLGLKRSVDLILYAVRRGIVSLQGIERATGQAAKKSRRKASAKKHNPRTKPRG
jgi:DNA-binding NarL/FixJ family response regulator